MAKIYESPDRGKTVYEREIGAPIESRKLVRQSTTAADEIAWRENAKENKSKKFE